MEFAHPVSDSTSLDQRVARLRERLGAERVDDMLAAAAAAGGDYLPGDEGNPVFGFLQRVLVQLKNAGKNYGMLFPKRDEHFRTFVDYFDGEDRIYLIYPGDEPEHMHMDAGWMRPVEQSHPDYVFHEVVPGQAPAIMVAFLEAYASLRARGEGSEQG